MTGSMRAIGIAVIGTVVWTAPAAAAPMTDACLDPSVRTAGDMSTCRKREHAAADSDLNRVYGQLVAANRDENGYVEALRKAQRAWLSFRDAQCNIATWDSRRGTAYDVYVSLCLTALTRARTTQLLELREGPVSAR